MTRLHRVLASITLGLMLAGPTGCKYTGGDADKASPASREQQTAPEQTKSTTGAPQQAGEKGQAPENQQENALGEGTDEQRALMAQAKKAFLSDQIGQAERLFKELAATEPVSGPQVSAVIALAQIYNETDRPEEAIALYEGLAGRVEDIAEVQLVVARAFAEQGESTRAIEAYKKLLEIQPDYVFAWLELGKLYSGAGRKEEATQALYKYEQRVYSLAEKLENPETKPADRLHILDVFSLVSDDRATKALVEALEAKEPQIRQRAATVLGETGSAEAKKLLEQTSINDPHLGVRMAAKDALKRLEEVEAPSGGVGPTFVKDKKALPAN